MREALKAVGEGGRGGGSGGATLGGRGGSTGALFKGSVVRKYPADQLLFRGGGGNAKGATGDKSASLWARKAGTFDCQNWSVVTTIYDVTPAIERTMHLGKDWCTVIVADRKTPQEAKYFSKFAKPANVAFISVPEQEQLARDKSGLGAYVVSVPWNHFGRKNLGYLFAISQGAQHVFDFDDDNALKPKTMPLGPWRSGLVDTLTKRPGREGAFNPYPFMGSTSTAAWPRGFPLPSITEKDSYTVDATPLVHWDDVGIFQAVADKDPDVDAMYRLTVRQLHFDFAAKHDPVALPAGVMAPYNAQACVHTRKAFWGMLLPISVPGRVSDIWRSYITQRLLWDVGMRIAFTEPTVVQDRTAHNFLRDMDAELDLYFKTPALLTFLQQWDGSAIPTIQERMEKLFADLYERGYLEREDVLAVGKWLRALESAGYAFPKVLAQSDPASYQKAILPAPERPRCLPRSSTLAPQHAQPPCVHNVLLVGQFNYAQKVAQVAHWYRRWREVFANVVVYGPFDANAVQALETRGVPVVISEADKGYFSPYSSLLDAYQKHAGQPGLDGALYAHDDLLFNFSNMMHRTGRKKKLFRKDEFVVTDWLLPNNAPTWTVDLQRATNFRVQDHLSDLKRYAQGWEGIVAAGVRRIASDPSAVAFLNNSLHLFRKSQSDAAYLPYGTSDTFREYAVKLLLIFSKHKLFLENAVPTLVYYLVNAFPHMRVLPYHLCTSWDERRYDPYMMLGQCGGAADAYDAYHPIKYRNLSDWNSLFDKIVV